jgi:hypothetical protein
VNSLDETRTAKHGEGEESGFSELIRYTIPGYFIGLGLGFVLDILGYQTSPIGQWIVRTITGEGESILEGVFSFRQRILGRAAGMAEAYGWGKLIGMTFPWWIDLGSRLLGVDVYSVESFYIPFFYGMSDQIGANISGLLFLRRREGNWRDALLAYRRHPVMVSGLVLIFIVPTGLLISRLLGFSPTTQVLTALEAIAANLCWIPPLLGMLAERD